MKADGLLRLMWIENMRVRFTVLHGQVMVEKEWYAYLADFVVPPYTVLGEGASPIPGTWSNSSKRKGNQNSA